MNEGFITMVSYMVIQVLQNMGTLLTISPLQLKL